MKRHSPVTARADSLAPLHRYPVCGSSAHLRSEFAQQALPTRQALLAVACAMLLGGCGGGTNNASTTSAQPVSVPLQAAITNEVDTGVTATFTVSGTIANVPVTGSGTLTDAAPVAATFNGATVLQTTETITDTVVENGISTTVTETKAIFTDLNTAAEVGQINDDGSVDVITQVDPIPASAPVGSSGVLGTGTEFSDTSQQTVVGTVEDTYVVESGTGSTGGSGTGSSEGSGTGSSGGSSTGASGGSGTGTSGSSGSANCDVVDFVKKVSDKNNAQIRKSEKKICVDDKGNSKFESGEEQEHNGGRNNDDFNENAQ